MKQEVFLVYEFEEIPGSKKMMIDGCIAQLKATLPLDQHEGITEEVAIERLSTMYWLMYDNEMVQDVSYIPVPGYKMSELVEDREEGDGGQG